MIQLDVRIKKNTKIHTLSPLTIFFSTLIATFILASLSYLGLRIPRLVSPLPQKSVFDQILPKLQQKLNTYHLKSPLSLVVPSFAASESSSVSSYAVIDFDSGEILEEKALSQKLPIASLTKIMTAVVALDLASPNETFEVPSDASSITPTRIGLVGGERIPLSILLHGMIMTSGNDAAYTIAKAIDRKYGSAVFVRAMNEKAAFLGLTHTHFDNPEGFDGPQNYSTGEDLAILSHYALSNYPIISEIAKKEYQFAATDDKNVWFDLYNWNGLLGVYPGVLGLKIGNTDDAGYTNIVLSQRENKKILVVVLGAQSVLDRDLTAAHLLDEGFKKSLGLEPVDVTEAQLLEKYSTWKYFN